LATGIDWPWLNRILPRPVSVPVSKLAQVCRCTHQTCALQIHMPAMRNGCPARPIYLDLQARLHLPCLRCPVSVQCSRTLGRIGLSRCLVWFVLVDVERRSFASDDGLPGVHKPLPAYLAHALPHAHETEDASAVKSRRALDRIFPAPAGHNAAFLEGPR
jgi:hypothetical protein